MARTIAMIGSSRGPETVGDCSGAGGGKILKKFGKEVGCFWEGMKRERLRYFEWRGSCDFFSEGLLKRWSKRVDRFQTAVAPNWAGQKIWKKSPKSNNSPSFKSCRNGWDILIIKRDINFLTSIPRKKEASSSPPDTSRAANVKNLGKFPSTPRSIYSQSLHRLHPNSNPIPLQKPQPRIPHFPYRWHPAPGLLTAPEGLRDAPSIFIPRQSLVTLSQLRFDASGVRLITPAKKETRRTFKFILARNYKQVGLFRGP